MELPGMIEMRPMGTDDHRHSLRVGFLDFVSSLPENLTMVEIGCYRGESTKMFLDSGKVKHITCIDPFDFGGTTGGGDVAAVRKIFMETIAEYGNKVTHIDAYSKDAVSNFADGSLDLVYIDGRHEYEYVHQDITLWLPKVRPGGIISGHDHQHPDVVRAIKEILGTDFKTHIDETWLKTI